MSTPAKEQPATGRGRLTFLAVLLSCATAANAATINYAALEELFGEPVTASATGSPQRESEVAATMIIVTADEIRRSGARDIPGVLRHVAGVDVGRTSNDHADVAVRGYNQAFSPRLLVLVDGRQVYADYYGFTPWSTVPVELASIRQIEIVKGPNSALFGFNAVGGVVNIVTWDPVRDDVDTVSLSAGTQGLVSGSVVGTWKIGNATGVRLSADHRDSDDFSTPLPPVEAGARRGNERNAISLDVVADVNHDLRIGVEATYSDARQAELAPTYTLTYADYETHSVMSHVAADTRGGLLQASVYSNRIQTLATTPDLPAFAFDNRVTVAQLQGITSIGHNHTLRLSAEYRENTMDTTPVPGGEVFYDVASLGGMWEWQVAPSLTWTTAARSDGWSLGRSGDTPPGYGLTNDDWDRSETELSYNAALVWQASETNTLRLLFGRGVQLPNLLNLGGLVIPLPPFGFISGVPDLSPSVVDNYELSWDRTLPGLGGRLRLGAFHGHSEDLVALGGGQRAAEGLLGTPVNIGDSRTAGFEASVDGSSDRWRWAVAYKYQEIDDDFAVEIPLASSFTNYEDTAPRHVVKANTGWQDGPWEVDAYLRYQSGFDGIRGQSGSTVLVPVKGHVTVDGRVGYAVNERITVAVTGRNLTRPDQRQTSAPNVERAVFGTISIDFGPR